MNLTDLVQEIKNELAAGPAIADISCRDIVVKLGSPRGSPGAEGVGFIANSFGPALRARGPKYFQGRFSASFSARPRLSFAASHNS